MAAKVKIYMTDWCGYCTAALRLLKGKAQKLGIELEQIDVAGDPTTRRWLVEQTGRTTVPQIFIDGVPVGGYTDIRALDGKGVLDEMLAGRARDQASSASG